MAALDGQVRRVSHDGRMMATGYDMTAALQVAAARGLPPAVAARFLPTIEAAAVRGLNGATFEDDPEEDDDG